MPVEKVFEYHWQKIKKPMVSFKSIIEIAFVINKNNSRKIILRIECF